MGVQVKVAFRLTQDDDGYPPVGVETVWASKEEGGETFVIDNIPFFTREATVGDKVGVFQEEGFLWFDHVAVPSSNSLVRIIFFVADAKTEVRRKLEKLGCECEFSKDFGLLAVNIPRTVPINWIQNYLSEQAARGALDYEEAILRQDS